MHLIRTGLAAALCALLAACTNSSTELNFPAMPAELADCRVFLVENASGASMTVARCPNSVTTTQTKSGKTTVHSIVVDGVEYVPAATNPETTK